MIEFVFPFIFALGCWTLYSGVGLVALMVLDFHAERAWLLILGRSTVRKGAVMLFWPITLIAVLILQFNPKYRGSNHDSIEYPDTYL